LNAFFISAFLNKIINFPIFFNPRLIIKVLSLYFRIKPDFVHAHDLPMVPLAIMLKKLFGVKIVFDVHESYPEALLFFKKKGIINFLFKNPKLAKILENYSLKKADKIIVVVREHKDKLITRGIREEKIYVVSNTVDIESYDMKESNYVVPSEITENFSFTYSGKVSPDRALDVPIKALKYIKEKIPDAKFVIVGEGPNVNDLKRLAVDLNERDNVVFMKWPGHENIPEILKASSVCIIPQPSNEFINSGVPNKLFEYMYMERTVLVSDAKPMSRIVRETNCGLVFKSNDYKDFAEKIIELSGFKENFGINGKKAVVEKYNWNNDSKELLRLYSDFQAAC